MLQSCIAARRREQRPRVIPTLSSVLLLRPTLVRRTRFHLHHRSWLRWDLFGALRLASFPSLIASELRHPSETAPGIVREVAVSIAASEQASRALSTGRTGVADQPAGPPETPTSTLQPPDTSQCELLASPQGSTPVGGAHPSLAFRDIEPQSPLPTAISASERADALTTLDAPAPPCPPDGTRMSMPERVATASVALRAHVHALPRHRRHSLSALDAAQVQQNPEPPVAIILPSHAAPPSGASGPLSDAS